MGFLVVGSALLGLLVGSFLNVVVHRVPAGASVVSPPSACPACDEPVRPRDNVPVLSWLLLRGRCRDCGAPIGVRYPLVEAGTAVLFGATAAWFGPAWHLPAFLYLAAAGVALAVIDVDVHRLPDAIVLPSYVVAGVLLVAAGLVEQDLSALVRAAAGCAALFGLYLLLAVVHPAGMGLGDVKLAGVLGMYLGYLGWAELAVGGFAGFVLGGLIGGAIALARGAGRKARIPFGPFMLAGTAAGVVAGDPLAGWYLTVIGL